MIAAWMRNSSATFRRLLSSVSFNASVPGAPGTLSQPTRTTEGQVVLTAEQLAGAINGDAPANGAQRTNGPPRTRRARRPRRTPSQISTHSLPVYNKEPGEEEVVIYRSVTITSSFFKLTLDTSGRDAEDATMPAARTSDSMDEDREDSVQQHGDSYDPLSTRTSEDLQSPPRLRQPPGEGMPRGSSDSESLSLLHETTTRAEPVGDAPPYFEVVPATAPPTTTSFVSLDPTFDPSSPPPLMPSLQLQTSAATSAPPTPAQHRFGIRSILNRMSGSHSMHARADSGGSLLSASSHQHQPSHDRSRSRTHILAHRASPSSSSLLSNPSSINLGRSTSRLGMTDANPSMISLHSLISPPLTHTTLRTDFSYPRTGPTAEQMKYISSRESLASGVPFGQDAVRWARDGGAARGSSLDLISQPVVTGEALDADPVTRASTGPANEPLAATTISAPIPSSPTSFDLPQPPTSGPDSGTTDRLPAIVTTSDTLGSTAKSLAPTVSTLQYTSGSPSISSSSTFQSFQSGPQQQPSLSEFGALRTGSPTSATRQGWADLPGTYRTSVSSISEFGVLPPNSGRSTVMTMRSYATAVESIGVVAADGTSLRDTSGSTPGSPIRPDTPSRASESQNSRRQSLRT